MGCVVVLECAYVERRLLAQRRIDAQNSIRQWAGVLEAVLVIILSRSARIQTVGGVACSAAAWHREEIQHGKSLGIDLACRNLVICIRNLVIERVKNGNQCVATCEGLRKITPA